MVRSPAGSGGAGVFRRDDRERSGWARKHPGDQPAVFDDAEPITPEASGLEFGRSAARRRTHESMSPAPRLSGGLLKVSAGNMQDGVDQEVGIALPELAEGDVLGMTEEPGSFLIERCETFGERAYPERDRQRAALMAESPTMGRGMHPGKLAAALLRTTP